MCISPCVYRHVYIKDRLRSKNKEDKESQNVKSKSRRST